MTQRGFVEGAGFLLPQEAANDPVRVVGDLLIRDEAFVKPAQWVQVAAGVDVRADSHARVDDRWRLDVSDRGVRRPRLSIRRLSATFSHRRITLDLGKQFIRWGKTDIVAPTDRFAPRDVVNVVRTEFLPVIGARAAVEVGKEAFEAVWVPRFTPSRVPLVNDRWTPVPNSGVLAPVVDGGTILPSGSETGLRWGHVGAGLEYSLSFFDGFNHLPNIGAHTRVVQNLATPAPFEIQIVRSYPAIRAYGADVAVPTRWLTFKGEAAYFTSSSPSTDEYVLYVVQLERQSGEWLFVIGYVGEAVTLARATLTFSPDRGLARAIVARASYTLDPNRSVTFEGVARQNGAGVYAKAEYSEAFGQHWRATGTVVVIAGHADDFLGQYHRNSHGTLVLRYSF